MKFSEWLKLREVGTSTSSVAVVPTPLFHNTIRRIPKKKRKHKNKKNSLPGQINYLTFNQS